MARPGGNSRGARLQETALHIDHQQGGSPRLQAVEVVNSLLASTQALIEG
jgi:hypothetical protein